MKQLSHWAKSHKKLSRLLIVVSFIILTALGIVTGMLLSDVGVAIADVAMFLFVAMYLAAVFAYPAKSLKGNKLNASAFYIRQKNCDFLLVASTFCMIVFFSNQPDKIFSFSIPLNATAPATSSLPGDSTMKTYKTIAAFSASLKDENGKSLKWKEKKKLLKEQVRAIKKDTQMSDGAKVGLIILSVLIAIGLFYLVAALACNLSCGGSEGAASVVLIGGTAVIILLLIVTIRAIVGRKKKPKQSKNDPDEPVKTD